MPAALLTAGHLRLTCRYVFARRGVLYYRRRVPRDLQPHYGGLEHRMVSLGTKDALEAVLRARKLSEDDDKRWAALRGCVVPSGSSSDRSDLLKLLTVQLTDFSASTGPTAATSVQPAPGPKLSEAFDTYLREHPKGATPKFAKDAQRVQAKATEALGDLPLTDYRRDHARTLRDALLSQGLATGSVRRHLTTLVAAWNAACRELDLHTLGNPFASVVIYNENEDAEERLPFTPAELATIAAACRAKDDDIRWIVALQMDTGARLGEVVGLRVEDVFLEAEVPHIHIRPHQKLLRTLKNANSERKVPLVGMALWGAQRALSGRSQGTDEQGWLFPRYASANGPKATHAANTINKWLGGVTGTEKTSHSFRHAMRDRLRAAGVPKDVAEVLGGWGTRSIADGYGLGYGLALLQHSIRQTVGEH